MRVQKPSGYGLRVFCILAVAGTHEVIFDSDGLLRGTYLYRLDAPQGSYVQTMLLAK